MNPHYEQYELLRINLQKEINSQNIPSFSFEAFKKSDDEKIITKDAKNSYKKSKSENLVIFKERRDEIIQAIINSKIPSWGNVNVKFF